MLSNEELLGKIQEDIVNFSELMLVDADINCSITMADDGVSPVVTIEYEGDDLGYMIGGKGFHLRSLQYIFSMIINKKYGGDDSRIYVNVDVGGYKKEKADKIADEVLQKAEDARILGEPIDLEPMNAAERRVVHTTLSTFSDIETKSFGEGRDRAVRIIPLNSANQTEEVDGNADSIEEEFEDPTDETL